MDNEARAIWDALTKPRQEILEAIKGDTDRGVIHAYFAPHVHWLESLGLIIDGNTRDQVITSKGRSVYAAGQANATPADERDSPAEIMGMWPTEPGHTFIRGLWRVSEKMIGELRTEEYELLSENPDELDAVRAENARLRAALGEIAGLAPLQHPTKPSISESPNMHYQAAYLYGATYGDESGRWHLAQIARKALDTARGEG